MATNVNERNVPDTPTIKMLDCLWEARNLSLYTVKICSNTNNFPPEYYQTMTGDMIKKAKDIYRLGKRANAIYVQGKTGHERRKLRKQVIKAKKGEMAKERIDASLHSWKSHAELGGTYKLLQRIDAYYANLWKEIKV